MSYSNRSSKLLSSIDWVGFLAKKYQPGVKPDSGPEKCRIVFVSAAVQCLSRARVELRLSSNWCREIFDFIDWVGGVGQPYQAGVEQYGRIPKRYTVVGVCRAERSLSRARGARVFEFCSFNAPFKQKQGVYLSNRLGRNSFVKQINPGSTKTAGSRTVIVSDVRMCWEG